MSRKPARFFSHSHQAPRLNVGLLSLCLLTLAPMLACLGGVIWHEWKVAQNARIQIPVQDQLSQSQQWQSELMPLLCAMIFAVLGVFFLAGWMTQRKKQEYAYFAAFSFLQGVGQFCAVDWMQQLLGASFLSELRVVLLVWEGSLAMLLGLALARTRASWMAMAVFTTVLVTSMLLLAPWISLPKATLANWEKYLFQVFVPLAYARGAAACLIQWNVLSQRRAFANLGQEMSLRIAQRRRELGTLGFGFLTVGALYAAQALFFSSADAWMRVFRLSHLVLLIACYGAGWMQNRLRDDARLVLRLMRHKNPAANPESENVKKAG
ncbi:MAG: hypothetical protein ACJ763_02110 [Bdellovibrionia bacterium]